MNTSRYFSIIRIASCLGITACTQQPMARSVPMDFGTPATASGPAVGTLQTSTMGDRLKAAGLDLAALPALDDIPDAELYKVMGTFADSLGIGCNDCHESDKSIVTPRMHVAKKMWSEFVQKLNLRGGQPVFCDSCHEGKLDFLDRSDDKVLAGWMQANFVDGLARKDGSPQTCSDCHGTPFDPNFLDGWEGAVADGGAAGHDAAVTDSALAPTDLATAAHDLGSATTCTVVLNEVQVAGSTGSSDEFVEIYNPCTETIALDGYTLVYRSVAGAIDTTLVKLAATSLGAGNYLVIGNASYSGTATVHYTSNLANAGGGIALEDTSNSIVDTIAWGTASNAYVEGSPAPAPPSGKSTARTPNGSHAHHDQSLDLIVGTPTPGAAN